MYSISRKDIGCDMKIRKQYEGSMKVARIRAHACAHCAEHGNTSVT
jgi:hypothetical protein